jgi:hypothetical protein
MIREVEGPSLRDLCPSWNSAFDGESFPGDTVGSFRYVGSGKGAISLVLKYLGQQGILENKTSEVLVNDWIGFWVYNQIQSNAFPVKQVSPRTRVVMVYHQYGFPQKMDSILSFANDKKLVVVEDCAHALMSSYKGKALGSFGDFAIYSFSKFCFCFALGGLRYSDPEFDTFARLEIARASMAQTVFKDLVKLNTEFQADRERHWGQRVSNQLVTMSYALYGESLRPSSMAIRLFKAKRHREIAIRLERYRYFRERVDKYGVCAHLEAEGVVPYVIPICGTDASLTTVVQSLKKLGVASGIYRFDMNRNLIEPRFEPIAWIPIHGRISDALFERLIEATIEAQS